MKTHRRTRAPRSTRGSADSLRHHVKAADEVWIVAALLHKHNPRRRDFTVDEIVKRAREENITGKLRPSIYGHVVQHCVANRPPSPSRLCYLIETRPGYRQLFRYPYGRNFYRVGGKSVPVAKDLPERYRHLLRWYSDEYNVMTPARIENDSILALRGLGKEIWEGVDPDEYVRDLRKGWE